jgi:hypothetical protein
MVVGLLFKKERAYLSISPCNYNVYTKHQQPTGGVRNDDDVLKKVYSYEKAKIT